jgi:TolB protein
MKTLWKNNIYLLAMVVLLHNCVIIQDRATCNRIAYTLYNYPSGNEADIYSVCTDGSNPLQLTDDPAADTSPAWSPDGKKIAFASLRSGQSQIFLMNADGSQTTQLTNDLQNEIPTWLPDGNRIAFLTTDGQGLWWWRVLDLQSGQISALSEPSYDFFYPKESWSPDGKRIAYMSLKEQEARNDGSSQIHVKNVDGSEDKALTNNIWANINPVWSPDSREIAFLSEMHGQYNIFALYVMNADGSHVRRLSEPIYSDTGVVYSWSPKGDQIAIADFFIGHITIVDVVSGKSHDLLSVSGEETYSSPAWQPEMTN